MQAHSSDKQNRHPQLKTQVRLLELAQQLTESQRNGEEAPLRAAEFELLSSKAQQLLSARYFYVGASDCPECRRSDAKAANDSGAGEPQCCDRDVEFITTLPDDMEWSGGVFSSL